eukprot:gnl/Chilomastix_cuspidata/4166.p1 GENE.gnl/Chilomastix_cuspidata/4166~~gnl/Chilomastix_cuspidata/4166.p1  ORF type:complete len:331 (-),score=132.98 gnl/Chilomastix_cuspidata/4166:63-1055(-)
MSTADLALSAANVAVPMLMIAALGFLCGMLHVFDEPQLAAMNKYVFAVGMPAMAFDAMCTTTLSGEDLRFSAVYLCVCYSQLGLAVAAERASELLRRVPKGARRCSFRPGAVGTHWLCTTWANSVILGKPVVAALVGAEQAARYPFFHMLVMILLGIPAATALLEAHAAGPRARHVWRKALLGVAKNPIVVGTVAGVLWAVTGASVPTPLATPVGWVAQSVTPVGVFAVGLFCSQQLRELEVRVSLAYMVGKGVASPALALVFGWAFRLPGELLTVSVLLAAMPLAVATYPFLAAYGTNQLRAPLCILGGIVALFPQLIALQVLCAALVE